MPQSVVATWWHIFDVRPYGSTDGVFAFDKVSNQAINGDPCVISCYL